MACYEFVFADIFDSTHHEVDLSVDPTTNTTVGAPAAVQIIGTGNMVFRCWTDPVTAPNRVFTGLTDGQSYGSGEIIKVLDTDPDTGANTTITGLRVVW